MDRQIKAELAWKIPYEIKSRVGTFALKELVKIKLKDFNKAPDGNDGVVMCVCDNIGWDSRGRCESACNNDPLRGLIGVQN
jgi:hypothetical protein